MHDDLERSGHVDSEPVQYEERTPVEDFLKEVTFMKLVGRYLSHGLSCIKRVVSILILFLVLPLGCGEEMLDISNQDKDFVSHPDGPDFDFEAAAKSGGSCKNDTCAYALVDTVVTVGKGGETTEQKVTRIYSFAGVCDDSCLCLVTDPKHVDKEIEVTELCTEK